MRQKHENMQLPANKLFQLGALKVKRCEDVLNVICCQIDWQECMFREFETCIGKVVTYDDIIAI